MSQTYKTMQAALTGVLGNSSIIVRTRRNEHRLASQDVRSCLGYDLRAETCVVARNGLSIRLTIRYTKMVSLCLAIPYRTASAAITNVLTKRIPKFAEKGLDRLIDEVEGDWERVSFPPLKISEIFWKNSKKTINIFV